MTQVILAEPFRFMALSSLGDATFMLLRQHKFPLEYAENVDVLTTADHDRCLMWDYKHATACFEKHLKTGELGLPGWLGKDDVTDEDVMAFLKDILKAEEHYPGVKFTGYRIMGTVNRSNGQSVFTLELFCNKSRTKTYSGSNSPNVKSYGKRATYAGD